MSYNDGSITEGLTTFMPIACVILWVLDIVILWKIFTKAGEAGWKSIVPVYNSYILFKIADGNGWKFLLMLIPVVDIVISILLCIDLAKAFGKSGGFAVGLVFFWFIFQAILAFGSAEYIGPKGERVPGIETL